MKFAEIKYLTTDINMAVSRFNSVFYPYGLEEQLVLGSEGYKIYLNVSRNSDLKSIRKVLFKTERFLLENNVTAVTGEKFDGIYTADGRAAMALFAAGRTEVMREVVIIGGNRVLTEILLCALCPRVNYISLYTEENYSYTDICGYFFMEYGITVQLINSLRHENLKNADIVINCAELSENYDYLLKNGCVYYDIFNDKKRIRHIRKIRNDVMVINSAVINNGEEKIPVELAECALYATSEDFRKLLSERIGCDEKLKIISRIKDMGIIDKFNGVFDGG